jgi:hypothetical protein
LRVARRCQCRKIPRSIYEDARDIGLHRNVSIAFALLQAAVVVVVKRSEAGLKRSQVENIARAGLCS